MIIAVSTVIFIAFLHLTRNTQNGFSSPEEAGKAWLESVANLDLEALKETMHPDMISDNAEKDMYIFSSESLSTISNTVSVRTVDIVKNDFIRLEEAMNKVFIQEFYITDAKYVEFEIDSYEKDEYISKSVIVIKIGGRWYSLMDNRVLSYYTGFLFSIH